MKKIIFIAFLFLNFALNAQISKANVYGYKEITTTQRDALTVPSGENWTIYNTDNSRFEYWDGSAWNPLDSGVPNLQQVTDVGSTTTNSITAGGFNLDVSTFLNKSSGDLNINNNNPISILNSNALSNIVLDNPNIKIRAGTPILYAILSTVNITGSDKTFNFPDASGTFALTNDLDSYVPYTGATNDVDLDSNTLTADLGFFTGSGDSNFAGNVGFGTTGPKSKVSVEGGDDKDSGPIIRLYGNSANQIESGRVRFNETDINYVGGYIHFDGLINRFLIGVHNIADEDVSNDINSIAISRTSGNVMINTITDSFHKLNVDGTGRFTGDVTIPADPYDSGWNGEQEAATKDAIYDKIESLGTSSYTKYVALVTQSGISAPSATVLENTLGGTPVWTRDSTGQYHLTLAGTFISNKTFATVNIGGNTSAAWAGERHIYGNRLSNNVYAVRNYLSGSTADTIHFMIEIRVYP